MRVGSVSNRGSSTLAGFEHRQRCRAPVPRPGPTPPSNPKRDFDETYYEVTAWNSTWRVRKDVFGNIHYGAMMNAAGLSLTEATAIAGLGEANGCIVDTGPECEPLKPIFGANSAADDFATEIGFHVDTSSLETTENSLYMALIGNIQELYTVSNKAKDPAVMCVAGDCLEEG
jgi:hypothetical protein